MEWNCTLTEERLSDYLEGRLSAEESATLIAHREHCERCAETVDQVHELLADMHALEPLQEPAHLQARILDATLGPRVKKATWRRWFRWTPMIWRPRFAIGLATVAVCATIVIQAGGVLPTKMHKADVNPADIVRSINRQAHLTYAQGARFVNNLRVVYEIESRLETQNPPQRSPGQPGQNNLRQKNGPQEKSDERGRSQSQGSVIYADSDANSATEVPDATPARSETSSVIAPAPIHVATPQPTIETQRVGRSSTGNLLFACAGLGDANLNQGFVAANDPANADGRQARPEWSAP